ncbi:unnamed protein product, partial [Closterium sp. Yama58-4]
METYSIVDIRTVVLPALTVALDVACTSDRYAQVASECRTAMRCLSASGATSSHEAIAAATTSITANLKTPGIRSAVVTDADIREADISSTDGFSTPSILPRRLNTTTITAASASGCEKVAEDSGTGRAASVASALGNRVGDSTSSVADATSIGSDPAGRYDPDGNSVGAHDWLVAGILNGAQGREVHREENCEVGSCDGIQDVRCESGPAGSVVTGCVGGVTESPDEKAIARRLVFEEERNEERDEEEREEVYERGEAEEEGEGGEGEEEIEGEEEKAAGGKAVDDDGEQTGEEKGKASVQAQSHAQFHVNAAGNINDASRCIKGGRCSACSKRGAAITNAIFDTSLAIAEHGATSGASSGADFSPRRGKADAVSAESMAVAALECFQELLMRGAIRGCIGDRRCA